MPIPDHVATLREGADSWNEWRRDNPEITPDLSKADLTWLEESRLDLHKTDLRDAVLKGAMMWEANFSAADLSGADMTSVYLDKGNLSSMKGLRPTLAGSEGRGRKIAGAALLPFEERTKQDNFVFVSFGAYSFE